MNNENFITETSKIIILSICYCYVVHSYYKIGFIMTGLVTVLKGDTKEILKLS